MNGKVNWLFFYIFPFTHLSHEDIHKDYLLMYPTFKGKINELHNKILKDKIANFNDNIEEYYEY